MDKYLVFLIGSIIGSSIVFFIEFLLIFTIINNIFKRKFMPYKLNPLKYSSIAALICGFLTTLGINEILKLVFYGLLLSILAWIISLF